MLNKSITIMLAVMIIGAIGTLVYVINQPRNVENFTEFYVLNTQGKAKEYPNNLIMGQSYEIILGIVNHESESTAYRIDVIIDGEKTEEINPINLDIEGKWERKITFTPIHTGTNQKIEFLLYKGTSTDVYKQLALQLDVVS